MTQWCKTCEHGTGWIITNPDWPNGDKPYRERCPEFRGGGRDDPGHRDPTANYGALADQEPQDAQPPTEGEALHALDILVRYPPDGPGPSDPEQRAIWKTYTFAEHYGTPGSRGSAVE